MPKVFTSHAAIMSDPVAAVQALYECLINKEVQGLRMPSAREILAFLDPKLYHEREASGSQLTVLQDKICAMLRGEIPFDPSIKISEKTREIMEAEAKKKGAQ